MLRYIDNQKPLFEEADLCLRANAGALD